MSHTEISSQFMQLSAGQQKDHPDLQDLDITAIDSSNEVDGGQTEYTTH